MRICINIFLQVTYVSTYEMKAKKTDVIVLPMRPIHEAVGAPRILNFSVLNFIGWIPRYSDFCLDGLATKVRLPS